MARERQFKVATVYAKAERTGNYAGAPQRFKRVAGQKVWTAPDFLGKLDVERELNRMERLGRRYTELGMCNFATKVMFLKRTRTNGTHYTVPVPTELCGCEAPITKTVRGQIVRRCVEHASR